MSTRGMKTGLIVQEGTMIPQTETPVLELRYVIRDELRNFLALVPMTVRFLRCGCPNVQWLVATKEFANPKVREEAIDIVHDALCNLQISGENFKIVSPELLRLGTVITITRTVAPKTEKTTFGELNLGDKVIIDGEQWVCINGAMTMTEGILRVLVKLTRKSKGQVITIGQENRSQIVEKIIE